LNKKEGNNLFRYPRVEPVALVKKQALLDTLRASSHSPTGKARGTLPFGFIEDQYTHCQFGLPVILSMLFP